MSDDIVFMIRRAAYVSDVRAVALRARRVALLALMIGVGDSWPGR